MHSSAPPKQTPTMDHGAAFNFWETLAAHCLTKTPPVQSVLHGAESWAPHDGGCRFRLPKHPGFPRVPTRDTMPTRSIGTSSPARRCFAQGQPWWLMPSVREVCVGCKLHVILYAKTGFLRSGCFPVSPRIPNEGVSSFPSLQFLLVSFASSGVARQHTS